MVVVVLVAVVVVLVDGAEVQTATYKQYLLPSHLSSSHHVQTGRAPAAPSPSLLTKIFSAGSSLRSRLLFLLRLLISPTSGTHRPPAHT